MTQSKLISELATHTLLFFLIFGMSATVDSQNLRRQLHNKYAILIGAGMQFVIMPCLGFFAVFLTKSHGLTTPMGISLLIVTSSPGGSYSNFWCSLFNADLALSVAMTALSTILSIAFLPANLLLYAWLAYGHDDEQDVLKSINFGKLFISIATVIVAILSGLYASFLTHSKIFRKWANRLGSISGILLILFSAFFSSVIDSERDDTNPQLWAHPPAFYIATIAPCLVGLALSNTISSRLAKLKKAEVVTLSVECCYQNVGIATSAAVSIFDTSTEISQALAVPVVYGLVEAVVLAIYCTIAWKLGWTKAPKDESFCTVICKTFEVEEETLGSENDIQKSSKFVITKNKSSNEQVKECCQDGNETIEVFQMSDADKSLFQFDSNSAQDRMMDAEKQPTRKYTDSTGDTYASGPDTMPDKD